MRVLVLGGGWYGCHLAAALRAQHEVLLLEQKAELFRGASGANPARLHIGPHYPRSQRTRRACQSHSAQFLSTYGELTRPIARNVYAIADDDSLMDFGTYEQVMRAEIDYLRVHSPLELGLANVEGGIMVNERHIVIDRARDYFARQLADLIRYNSNQAEAEHEAARADLVIDCTFCSSDEQDVARFEPCMTLLLEGPTMEAVTIMDGPFPSLYPWDEDRDLCSLTSAKWTPISRERTHARAREVLAELSGASIKARAATMLDQMAHYMPRVRDTHRWVGQLFGVRAMPRSGSDARLVQVLEVGPNRLRIRAGKIDAIFDAEHAVRGWMQRRLLEC